MERSDKCPLCVCVCGQVLQDLLGSVVFLATADGGFRPTRQDVFEFIKQCSSKSLTDPDEVTIFWGFE